MGWPKGVSRKGYTNKDGTPHAVRGKVTVKADPIVVSAEEVIVETEPVSEYELHGMVGKGAITSPCPNCMYAYADGGYCPDCGWSAPIHREPYGTYSGGRL